MGPVCVNCSVEMKCKRNEVWFIKKDDVARSGDLWACNCCKTEVLTGFGRPVYSFEKSWEELMDSIERGSVNVVFAKEGCQDCAL